jgi:hypothetical protein
MEGPRCKKKSKSKHSKLKHGVTELQEDAKEGGACQELHDCPGTPIAVMQHVGIALGIDPADLTDEKLTADPSDEVIKKA